MQKYIENLKSYLEEHGKKCVAVWPAGNDGISVCRFLKEQNIEVAFFIDKDAGKQFSVVENKTVFSPGILDFVDKETAFVFIASKNNKEAISKLLTAKNYAQGIDFGDYLCENFNRYKNLVKTAKEAREYAAKYPLNQIPLFNRLEIETFNRCNGLCSFCPANAKADKRPLAKMSENLLRKILSELKDLKFSGYMQLFSNNEPFLDSRMEEFIKLAKKEVPTAFHISQSNGLVLTLEKFKAVIDYLDFLIIDNYRDDYEFHKNVKDIYEYCKNSDELKLKVRILKRLQNEVLTSRAGDSPNHEQVQVWGASCIHPFSQMVVRPTGLLSICCNDALGNSTLGDLNKTTIADAWNSDRYVKTRECILQGREFLPTCKGCDNFPSLVNADLRKKDVLPNDSFFTMGRKDLFMGLKK